MTPTATAPRTPSAHLLLGGRAVIRHRPRSALDWVEVVRGGLPSTAVEALSGRLGVTQGELAAVLGISERTLARRKREGVLNEEESAKLVRLARVVERTAEVFEGLDPGLDWLRAPNEALGAAPPLSLVDTDVGAEAVFDTLGRIEHGVFV